MFSTWLVTVTHNQVIDWVRRQTGRRRTAVPAGLSELQQSIFAGVFVELRSHAETYEILRASSGEDISFSRYLKELAAPYRAVERARPSGVMHYLAAPYGPEPIEPDSEKRLAAAEIAGRLSVVLDGITAEERVALRLFVVEGVPAADVARTLAWPNAKAVYNRISRLLERLRAVFERDGLRPPNL